MTEALLVKTTRLRPLIRIASRYIALGLAAREIAIADVSKAILPINNSFSQILV